MVWTSPATPRPRATPSPYTPWGWPSLGQRALSRVDSLPAMDTAQLLMGRRSCRKFGAAPAETALGHLLYLSAFALFRQPSPYGFHLQQSCVPSAGAIHGVHILVLPALAASTHLYDPVAHSLVELQNGEECAALARAEASKLIELGKATLFLFAAEPGMYSAKYEACESLVWRDAGVLQGHLSVVAQSLDLGLCILGLTGDEALCHLGNQSKLLGVGMAAVGSRA